MNTEEIKQFEKLSFKQYVNMLYGYIFIRPLRYFSHKIACASFGLHILPYKRFSCDLGVDVWELPNIGWWIMYKTIGALCLWAFWNIKYKLRKFPKIAYIIHDIAQTLVAYSFHGGECYHCGSKSGDPVDLSDDKTGKKFILKDTWNCATADGTDYRFWGITICPACGYRDYYEDGSL